MSHFHFDVVFLPVINSIDLVNCKQMIFKYSFCFRLILYILKFSQLLRKHIKF